MKYVLMIHSNPQPWGHPTSHFLAAHKNLTDEQRKRLNDDFEQTITELVENGQLVAGEALGDPKEATLHRWRDDEPLAVDRPYSETKEHLAGFFVIDVESRERAEQVADKFAGPGETVELRAIMGSAGDEQ